HGFYLRGDDRGFALAGAGGGVEPVPARPRVGFRNLTWQEHQPAVLVGARGNACRGGDLFRRLLAAVDQDDQRPAPPSAVALRDVQEIIARWPDPGAGSKPT